MQTILSKEHLKTIEDLSSVGYSLSEIAEVMQISELEINILFEDKTSDFSTAYLKGKNVLKYKVRKSLSELAQNGSMPATIKLFEIIQNQETDEGTI